MALGQTLTFKRGLPESGDGGCLIFEIRIEIRELGIVGHQVSFEQRRETFDDGCEFFIFGQVVGLFKVFPLSV